MTRRTAFFFLTFLLIALVFAPAVHAESLVMNMKRTVTFTPASESTPPIVTDEVVTFYPEFISVRTGNAERIYNFAAKTLVVFDHADKTYMIHPLHAVPIFYERERTRRLAMKIKMNEATREAGGAAVDKVFLEDIDLDMAFSAFSNYGQSILRPSFWLGVIFALSMYAYKAKQLPKLATDGWADWAQAALLSASNSLPFLPQSRELRKGALQALYDTTDPSSFIDALMITQGVLSFIFLFLIGLGLRNRFRL